MTRVAATPLFGWQIKEFQVHHRRPWAVNQRQLADLYIQAAAVTALHSPINMFCNDPFLLGCMGVFSSCMMFSQHFHAWSHTPKGKLLPLVAFGIGFWITSSSSWRWRWWFSGWLESGRGRGASPTPTKTKGPNSP
ncbi:UNVERIFIED_CONTAM: hypothetical protein Sradi_6481700 [Sesamum radiatum]|uniref:Lipid desaturase domain-containing protein n=1 Tax=Sesamum radiatum TaxID=300843 RepID=A0AAW2K683_SESRA